MSPAVEKSVIQYWMTGSSSEPVRLAYGHGEIAGALPAGAIPKMSEAVARTALYYTRLNLLRSEVTGGSESDKRVKGAWATAFKLAEKAKSPQEQMLMNKAKDCLLDQEARLDYNLALNTYLIDDGWRIDNDLEASLNRRIEQQAGK